MVYVYDIITVVQYVVVIVPNNMLYDAHAAYVDLRILDGTPEGLILGLIDYQM